MPSLSQQGRFQAAGKVGRVQCGTGIEHDHLGRFLTVLGLAFAQCIADQRQRPVDVLRGLRILRVHELPLAVVLHGHLARRLFKDIAREAVGENRHRARDLAHPAAQARLADLLLAAEYEPEALALYRKAADQGDSDAQYNLGVAYDEGEGVPQDHQQAVAWYRKAAAQNHVRAQFNLAVSYDDGEGVAQDKKQAVHWYTKAAEQGDADAQQNLSVMYAKGEGVPADLDAAVSTLEGLGDARSLLLLVNLPSKFV